MVANDVDEGSGSASGAAKKPRQPRTIDDLYRQSSQYRMWSFTHESLQEIKTKTNEKGRKKAIETFNTALAQFRQTNSAEYEAHASELTVDLLLDLLTLEEETKYINFYCKNIIETANFFRMPTQVKATAVSFFRKFYLVHSTMEYHPKNIMYTCVFLAAKSENYFISINSFTKALRNTENKDILDLEFTVLEALHFTLLVHHAFRPLYGFYLDFQAVLLHPEPRIRGLTNERLASLLDKGKEWIMEKALLSDIPFLYTPPQVALAAAYAVDKEVCDLYLKIKFQDRLKAIKEEPENEEKAEMADTQVKQEEDGVKQESGENGSPEKSTNNDDSAPLTLLLLSETVQLCLKDALSVPDSTVEENKTIDRKCYFALRPKKLIEKRIKKLSTQSGNENA